MTIRDDVGLPCLTLLMLGLILPAVAHAQTRVEGTVSDAETHQPLVGVNVFVEGTTLGTITDRNGLFALTVDELPGTFVFSMIGYLVRSQRVSEEGTALRVSLEPRVLDLQPVIVSASREEERRTDAPIAIAALSARELDERKPSMFHEALRTLPGVHVTDLGNEQHTMSIRQPMSYRALFVYMEDGIPIRPTGIFNHNALIEINMGGIDRVEVVRGPSSSLYGSNVIGGAINFITPRPSQVPDGALNLRTDSHGYQRADFRASSTVGRLGTWVGGYLARGRGGWAEHSDFDKVSLSARADYAFAPATRLITTFSANHLDTATNGSLDSLSFYTRGFTSLQSFTYRKVDAYRLTTRLQHVWNARQSTDAALYWRGNTVGQLPHYRIRIDYQNPGSARGEVNEDRFTSLGGTLQHRTYFKFRDARLIAGMSGDRSPNQFMARHIDVMRDPESGRFVNYAESDSLLTRFDVDLVNTAAYAQFEMSPMDRVKLVASLRYDRIDYVFDNHLPPSSFSGAPDGRDGFNRLSPRAGLTVDLGGGRGVYGNVSQGFLPPEVSELYRGVKTPVLRPSVFNSYETGGWAALFEGRVYVDASVYRMDGTNEIITVRTEDGDTEYRNAGKTSHYGIEYAIAYAPSSALTVRFSGTNARHKFVEYEDQGQRFDGNEMDAAPGWTANAEVMVRPAFLPGARFGLEWQHLGSYYMDPQNTLRYGGYDLLNLRLGYAKRNGLEVWASVQNLTDTLYANIAAKSHFGQQYNPGAPRSIGFGLGYRFGRS